MIVLNLWFIRHSNGLFHYGLDYAAALSGDVREVWVRDPDLSEKVRARMPGAKVMALSLGSLFKNLLLLRRRGDLLLTPSSHPLPLARKSVVVVHDSYPFESRVGRLKKALFRAGLTLSGGTTGFINRSDAYRFLDNCGVPERRRIYLPNCLGSPRPGQQAEAFVVQRRLIIGLFGTDSPKKNYDALFEAFGACTPATPVRWRIYGHENAYTQALRSKYPGCVVEIVRSDDQTMDAFVDSIDLAVSIAIGEGFGRPIALSLMRCVPTWLLDTPIFREFYAGSAQLFPSVEALVAGIARLRPGDRLERPSLASEAALRDAFDAGVDWLHRQGVAA